MKTPIYVIGHRNPDTDSVCSAVCYARFKTIITGECYIPKRAGHLNEETQFVDRKSTRLNSSHSGQSRMPSSA